MISDPDISIVIPAHNEENYLAETLSSIKKAVDETRCAAEIIVVNDSSTDKTVEVAKRFDVTVVNVELRNIGAVRNAGAKQARGKYIVFIDADTLLPCQTLQQTIDELENGAVGGGARLTLPDLDKIPILKKIIAFLMVTFWQRIGRWAAGCYMYCLAESFREMGGFDERYYAAEEYFFSRALKKRGKFVIVKTPVITSSRKLHSYSLWQIIKFLTVPLLNPFKMLKTRKGLDILYKDER